MQKLTALFTTTTGWAHIFVFLVAGFTALSSHGANWAGDVVTVLTVIGGIFFPTNMVGGRSIPKR